MKTENEKAIKKEDVKILKVKKAARKTPEQIEEEKRLKAAEKRAAERSKDAKPKRKKSSAPKPDSAQTIANSENEVRSASDNLALQSEKQTEPAKNTLENNSGSMSKNDEASSAAAAPQTVKKLVFLCTGNTCRSPMAEFIFKAAAQKHGRSAEYEVSSAGLGADGGVGLAENAAFALAALSIPFTNRKSTQMSVRMARDADLIICMTANHKQAMVGLNNCVTLSELCGCGDIPDPYGQSKEAYLNTAKILSSAIESLFK